MQHISFLFYPSHLTLRVALLFAASQALREGAAKLRKLVAKKAGGASVASNDDKRKPAPTIPYLDCPKAFEPPRKKVKEEPRSD